MPVDSPETGDTGTFNESKAITLKVGESIEIEYMGSYVFMPNYETYNWYIVDGEECISIDGSRDSCTITALSAGKAVVKCGYSYGKDVPNVLTGIPENKNRTKTKYYYIIVE